MDEWRCTLGYSIFIVYLSYIYSIFMVYLSYVVGKERVGSKEQGIGGREQGARSRGEINNWFFVSLVERWIYMCL